MFVSVLIVHSNTTNMSIKEKSTKPNDLCKGHAARGDKDFYRLCPSKLNKRELEDLYYSLLDKNLELKREANVKNERIRMLNTKVQRMTACTKPHLSSGKDCCAGAKALITEQKQSIADLKKANDAMAERIKRLNVKLCTAKQFLKQSPPQIYKGLKYITVPTNSCRNLSSGLANKTSTDNMRSTAVSARSLASDHPERKSVETNTEEVNEEISPEKNEKDNLCSEIQCRSAVEQFQIRILDLQKELSKTHAEYSSRMGHLERKVSQLQSARIQEAYLRHSRDSAVERDLATQVSVEKKKMADLEMRLKSASMSQEVANTIAEHLKNANQLEERRSVRNPSGTASPHTTGLSPVPVPPLSAPDELATEAPYRSDDSGYADTRRDSDHEEKIENSNREVVKRIADLQAQLDAIKMSAHDHLQPTREPDQKTAKHNSYDVIVDELQVPVLKNVKDYNCFIIDPDKKVIIEVEHVNKDGSFETFDRDSIKNPEETKGNLEPDKDVSEVPESIQLKRKPYLKPESPECSRKLPETDFQQYNTINEQKRGIQDAYNGSENSPLVLRRTEERFDVLGKPVYEVSKPVEDKANEIVQPNDPPQVQTQNDVKDNSVLSKKEQKRGIQDAYDGSENSPLVLRRPEERFDVLGKPVYEVSKPVEDKANEIVQPNDPTQVQTQDDVKDNSVLSKKQTDKRKKGNKIICECPIEEEEPLKDNEPVRGEEINRDRKNNRWPIIRSSIDDINSIEKPIQKTPQQQNVIPPVQNETPSLRNATLPMQNEASPLQNATSSKHAAPKSDNHNSMQIPGPIPVNSTSRDSNANKVPHSSLKFKVLKHRIPITCIDDRYDAHEVNAPECRDMCLNRREIAMTDANKGDVNATDMKPVDNTGITGSHVVFDKNYEMHSNDSFPCKYFNYDTSQKDAMKNVFKSPEGLTAITESPIQLSDVQNERAIDKKTEIVKCFNKNCKDRRVSDKIEPRLENRPTMRTREQLMTSAPNSDTFIVLSPHEKQSRATSPDNTDYEISHLSDLPTEKDGVSTRVLSPGEHMAISTTYTDSYTPYNDTSLSEGEVPNRDQKRKTSISVGECTRDKPANNNYNQSSAEKMEAALQAISQELARCRALLETQRTREQQSSYKDAATAAGPLHKDSIALHKSKARSCMSGANVPKCIFTMHIGTIVLSEEAVIKTRTTPLMLTWRFFDQNVVMTRMGAGRVVHFDFSTQYVIKITEEFIQHLKYEEMPIRICVIDENQTPYASCSLPLREALLNANHRVDISRGLVAHSNVNRKSEEVESSDEVGVLDLWCMLCAQSDDLAMIKRTFDSTNKPTQVRRRNDDLYYDYRNSQDVDTTSRIDNRRTFESDRSSIKFDVGKSGVNNDYRVSEPKSPCNPDSSAAAYSGMKRHGAVYDEKDVSVGSDLGMDSFDKRQVMTSGPRHSGVKKELGPDFQRSPFRESIMYRNAAKVKTSGIILTEVTPKRRSPEEMKNIWESNTLIKSEDVPNMDRQPTNIDRSRRGPSPVQVAVNGNPNAEPDANNKSGDKNPVSPEPPRKVSYALDHREIPENPVIPRATTSSPNPLDNKLEITILWLTLNEECKAMRDPNVRRLYLAYSFLGRDGAELETPVSLPKPKHYGDKCFFNFKKTFYLTEFDMPILDHMAKCRSQHRNTHNSKDCIVFWVVSEPPEDPLGLDNCEDIGYACLYLGDELAYSMEDSFTEVLPVSAVKSEDVIGVLAVRLDGLDILRARVGRPQ